MYVDSTFYTEQYGGGLIPPDCFFYYAQKAEAYLDYLTFKQASQNVDDNIKMAACELAELYYKEELKQGKTSESNDGYSISFDTSQKFYEKLLETALIYITYSGLCYRGGSYYGVI